MTIDFVKYIISHILFPNIQNNEFSCEIKKGSIIISYEDKNKKLTCRPMLSRTTTRSSAKELFQSMCTKEARHSRVFAQHQHPSFAHSHRPRARRVRLVSTSVPVLQIPSHHESWVQCHRFPRPMKRLALIHCRAQRLNRSHHHQ